MVLPRRLQGHTPVAVWRDEYDAAGGYRRCGNDQLYVRSTFNQLASVTDPLGRTTTRFVDAMSRLVQTTNPLGQSTTHTCDALNAVTQTMDAQGGTTAFTYDANRNLLTLTDALNHTTTYTYDIMDRVETRTDPLSRGYDPADRRVTMTVTGQPAVTYGYDNADRLTSITQTDANGTRALLVDALGTTLALADASGMVQTSYTYEPVRTTTISGTASANATQFTGRENDGTGFYSYRTRFYSPGLQRFVSEHPIGFAGGLNVYAYARRHHEPGSCP